MPSLLGWNAAPTRDGRLLALRDTDRDRDVALARTPGRVSLQLTGSTFVGIGLRGDTGGALANRTGAMMLAMLA